VAFLHEYTRATCMPKMVAGAEPYAGFFGRGFTSMSWGEERGVLRAPRASHLTHPGRGNRTKNRRNPLGITTTCVHEYTRARCVPVHSNITVPPVLGKSSPHLCGERIRIIATSHAFIRYSRISKI